MGNSLRKQNRLNRPERTSFKEIAILKRVPAERQHVRMTMDQFPGITFDWKHKRTILEADAFSRLQINHAFVINMLDLMRFIDRHDHHYDAAEVKTTRMVVAYGNSSQTAEMDKLLHTFRKLVLWDFTVLDKGRQWVLVSCSVSKRPKHDYEHRRVYLLN